MNRGKGRRLPPSPSFPMLRIKLNTILGVNKSKKTNEPTFTVKPRNYLLMKFMYECRLFNYYGCFFKTIIIFWNLQSQLGSLTCLKIKAERLTGMMLWIGRMLNGWKIKEKGSDNFVHREEKEAEKQKRTQRRASKGNDSGWRGRIKCF